jgi:hypothetical protein
MLLCAMTSTVVRTRDTSPSIRATFASQSLSRGKYTKVFPYWEHGYEEPWERRRNIRAVASLMLDSLNRNYSHHAVFVFVCGTMNALCGWEMYTAPSSTTRSLPSSPPVTGIGCGLNVPPLPLGEGWGEGWTSMAHPFEVFERSHCARSFPRGLQAKSLCEVLPARSSSEVEKQAGLDVWKFSSSR